MSWAFNELDVFMSDTDVDFENHSTTGWFNVSDYGTVRSRPTITSSTFSGSSINIPGKNGLDYESFDKRGNAKIEFEILIAEDWPHARLYNPPKSVWDRIDVLLARLYTAKVISYQEPGKEATFFYKVKRLTATITDAYAEAATIKATAEVTPFRYDFSGWAPTQLQNGSVFQNKYAGMPCAPALFISGTGAIAVYNSISKEVGVIASANDTNDAIVIDSEKMLAYFESDMSNANAYLEGNYDVLRVNGHYMDEVLVFQYEGLTNVRIATKDGIVI